MAKVKCRYCGKELNKKDAYAVRHGRVHWYYCSEEHSTKKTPREEFYEEASKFILTTSTYLYKELDEIAKIHSYEKMKSYLVENREMIERYLNRDFCKEYAKIRYFSSILKNNLGDYVMPVKEELREIDVIDVEVNDFDTSTFRNKQEKGMDDLLSELLG